MTTACSEFRRIVNEANNCFVLFSIISHISYYPDIVMRCLLFDSIFLNNATRLNGRAE